MYDKVVLFGTAIVSLTQVGVTRGGDYRTGSMVWADSDEMVVSDALPDTYQIVGHSQQFDGPLITDKFACLDCRAAFSLDRKGQLQPETRLERMFEWFF